MKEELQNLQDHLKEEKDKVATNHQQNNLKEESKAKSHNISVNLEDQLFATSIMERLGVKPDVKGKLNVLADTKAVTEVTFFHVGNQKAEKFLHQHGVGSEQRTVRKVRRGRPHAARPNDQPRV